MASRAAVLGADSDVYVDARLSESELRWGRGSLSIIFDTGRKKFSRLLPVKSLLLYQAHVTSTFFWDFSFINQIYIF